MTALTAILGAVLLLSVLLDTFETIVLPRRVTRRLRLTAFFYRFTWRPFAAFARRFAYSKRRETVLGFYGPASLLLLLALWAFGITFAFALLQYAGGSALQNADGRPGFATDLYYSSTTVFTLGLGDVHPVSALARVLTALESALGLGLLALVIGYFPVIYQSFSRREISVSLLDGRAGTPPSVSELLYRYTDAMDQLSSLMLKEWEVWSAELLESHLSYPVLAYFRSQHDNQSWLACLTTVLDVSALLAVSLPDGVNRQAFLTFAMARHAVVDLANVFRTPPRLPGEDRLPHSEFSRLSAIMADCGLRTGDDVERRVAELRRIYEPYVTALSAYLIVALPPWIPIARRTPNWLTTAWGRTNTPSSVSEPFAAAPDERP